MTKGTGFTLSPLALGRHTTQLAQARGGSEPMIVYAFADERFDGNPAAVALFETYRKMRNAFTWRSASSACDIVLEADAQPNHFEIRWFTQNAELDLCGHGTFAAAHWLFSRGYAQARHLTFHSRKGPLSAWRDERLIRVELPAIDTVPVDPLEHKLVERRVGIRWNRSAVPMTTSWLLWKTNMPSSTTTRICRKSPGWNAGASS